MLALLAGCGSVPPPRYHTLMPAAAPAARPPAPAGSLAWEVLPVAVPAGVDQPQWVVRTVDGSLAVLEQERWVAPLGGEIRAAVVERLTQVFGAPAVSADPRSRWRIKIDVHRFDSSPAREARLEATWTLSSDADAAAALRCRGEFVQTLAASGYPALAQGHQQAVATLADAIGSELRALNAGQTASCSPPA
ncbi:MAG TPA: PqiC family protein [Burkholderiaceae bacterium]|nr:PqiC family protein [Burkholderiaceae bacterium]